MKKNKIAVMCPTRDRSDMTKELYESWYDTKSVKDLSDFFIVVDDDQKDQYLGNPFDTTNTIISPKGRRGMVDAGNYGAKYLANHYDYVMFVGSDHRFRTLNWDEEFLNAIKNLGDLGYVYGNDLLQGANLPTEVMVSSNIIRALGHFIWPELQHLFVDNYWLELGRALNKIIYLPNIIIEHMHYSVGKSEHDDAYKEVNTNEMVNADSHAFSKWNLIHKEQERRTILERCEWNLYI